MKKYYIAYGSNMHLEDMKKRCPDNKFIGTSKISNYELVFRGDSNYLAATIEHQKNSYVPVIIFEISQTDEKNLDIYEDFPTTYNKQFFDISLNNKTINGMIYIMNPNKPFGKPDMTYFNKILTGYKEFNFDIEILNNGLKKSINNIGTY